MVQYLKKIFRTEKIRKKIMTSFDVNRNNIGGNYVVLYDKAV